MLHTQVCVFCLFSGAGFFIFWYFVAKVEEVTLQYHTPIYDEVAPDEIPPVEDYLVPRDLPYNPYENIDAIYSRIRYATDSESSSFSWGSSGSTTSR
jgi:hypothetical protein